MTSLADELEGYEPIRDERRVHIKPGRCAWNGEVPCPCTSGFRIIRFEDVQSPTLCGRCKHLVSKHHEYGKSLTTFFTC